MYKWSWIFVIFMIGLFLQAQENADRSFVMIRCDNGNKDFLPTPSSINLSPLLQNFNKNVDTIIFVHGFNVTYNTAKERFTENADILRVELGDLNYVGFYWPSDVNLDFTKGVENANKTAQYLIYVACEISRWYGTANRKIHIISHSLGGRVTLNTLKQNDAQYVKWGHCFQMASAISNDAYFGSFANTNLVPRYTYVYYSMNDWVLKYLYSLYEWLFGRNSSRFDGTQEKARWDILSFDEKIEYLRELDIQGQRGILPTNEFDCSLYEAIQTYGKSAMGLTGAVLGDPVTITKVTNVDMSNVVDGHTYWCNTTVMKHIASHLSYNITFSVEELFESREYYATREEAVANVPVHVSPKYCFVWCDGTPPLPWRPIPGTGWAHWVAHQKGDTGSPGCYDGYAIHVTQVTSGRTRYSIANARVGDVWTTTDLGHCGIVIAVGNGQVQVRHCSSGQGGVVVNWFSSGYSWR